MKSFFINYEDINTSTKHLKDKIIRTPEISDQLMLKNC